MAVMDRLSFLQKVLKILLYLSVHGSSHFVQDLRRNATFVQEATVFSGPPDPLHGNSLYQKVRATAQDLASTLFADASALQPSSLTPRLLSQAGMGSRCQGDGSLQGFGNTQVCVGAGESLLTTIQKVAGVMSGAVHPGPNVSSPGKPDEDAYQAVMAPLPSVSCSVAQAHPIISTHRRASRQPGLAGGGWEENDSAHSSQRSSQENLESGQTSRSSSDSYSGASREAGDLTERMECVQLSDCIQEVSLVDTVTQGTKVFLTKEEVQRFVKECALLNCETVLELLNRKLLNPSISVQMRSMSAISSLMCSDLLSSDHMFFVTHRHLERLSTGTPGPAANRATKLLRQFEALNRSKGPPSSFHLENVNPPQHEGDLLADSTPLPAGESVLTPVGMACISRGSLEQSRETDLCVLSDPFPPPAADGCIKDETDHAPSVATDRGPPTNADQRKPIPPDRRALSADLPHVDWKPPKHALMHPTPVPTKEQSKKAADRLLTCSSEVLALKGDLKTEGVIVPSALATVPFHTSLFAGMDIVSSSSTRLHYVNTRVPSDTAEDVSTLSRTLQCEPGEFTATSNAKILEQRGSSAFSFLNI
ncbi:AP-4 complex accessory subunit tepsin isoform X2 [Ambystoma mexicanum]|uniref:AP-4 complex accessory subunit tepsin isoform X2 n=1 Tax=Ambystoma mexicanum TaxID=8296 RepID=UPI0037E7EBA9